MSRHRPSWSAWWCLILVVLQASAVLADRPTTPPPVPPPGNWPSFDDFHSMSRTEQEQVELAWLRSGYRSDPKWVSHYHWDSQVQAYRDDGLAKVPGFERNAGQAYQVVTTPGFRSYIWGNCGDTATETSHVLNDTRINFMNMYYPWPPPHEMPNYPQSSEQVQARLAYQHQAEVLSVPVVGALPGTHQTVRVWKKDGAPDMSDVFYFDPWFTGHPEVLTFYQFQGRDYCFMGRPVKYTPSRWEPQTLTTTPTPSGGGGGGGSTGDPPDYQSDTPDDNIDVARQPAMRLRAPNNQALRDAYIRLARRAGYDSVADAWATHDEAFVFGSGTSPSLFFSSQHMRRLREASGQHPEFMGVEIDRYAGMIQALPDVAVLAHGFQDSVVETLNNWGIPCTLVDSKITLAELRPYRLVVLPSGALEGLWNAEAFRATLDEYVRQGGNVEVMTQPQGAAFSSLPGCAELQAHGWQQDQSCFRGSVSATAFHPALAGQRRLTPDLHIDGFFSSWPDSMQPALIRSRNPVPVLLTSGQGAGQLILTTSFADWGSQQGMSSGDDATFLRDLTLWGMHASEDIPHATPGSLLEGPVVVANSGTAVSTSARARLVDAAGRAMSADSFVPVSLAPGTTTSLELSFTAPSAAGMYEVDVELLDISGGVISRAYGAGAMASASLEGDTRDVRIAGGISAAVVATRDRYLVGEAVPVEVQVFGDGVAAHEVQVTFDYPNSAHSVRDHVMVPTSGMVSVPFSAVAERSWVTGRVRPFMASVRAQDDLATVLANAASYLRIDYAEHADVSLEVTPESLAPGSTATLRTRVQKQYPNSADDVWVTDLRVRDPDGNDVLHEQWGAAPQPETFEHTSTLSLDMTAVSGEYVVEVWTEHAPYLPCGVSARLLVSDLPFQASLDSATGEWSGQAGRDFPLRVRVSATAADFDGFARLQVPDAGFDEELPVSASAGSTATLDFHVELPALLAQGQHLVSARVRRDSGEFVDRGWLLDIPPAQVEMTPPPTSAAAGSSITWEVRSVGGVPATGVSEHRRLTAPQGGVVLEDDAVLGDLAPGAAHASGLSLPADLAAGAYLVESTLSTGGQVFGFRHGLQVTGGTFSIVGSTTRAVVPPSEAEPLTADFTVAPGVTLAGGAVEFSALSTSTREQVVGRREPLRWDARRLACSSSGATAVMGPEMGVKCYDDHFRLVTSWGDTREGEAAIGDGDLDYDGDGNLYVLDGAARTVTRRAANGATTSWSLQDAGAATATSIACDGSGMVHVGRGGGTVARVDVYSGGGVFQRSYGSRGTGAGQFLEPGWMGIDTAGQVAISDPDGARVCRFDSAGQPLAPLDLGGKAPGALGTWQGRTHVHIPETDRVLVFDSSGTLISTIGHQPGQPNFYNTKDLAGRGGGKPAWLALATVSQLSCSLHVIDATGIVFDEYGSQGTDQGIALLPDGGFLAANMSGWVWRWSPARGLEKYIGRDDLGDRLVAGPMDLALGPGGFLFVSDNVLGQVRIFDGAGALVGSLPSTPLVGSAGALAVMDDTVYLLTSHGSDPPTLLKMTSSGEDLGSFVVGEAGEFALDVAIDPEGALWISGSRALRQYSPAGNLLQEFPQHPYCWALGFDDLGRLHAARMTDVVVLDPQGQVLSSRIDIEPTALDVRGGREVYALTHLDGFDLRSDSVCFTASIPGDYAGTGTRHSVLPAGACSGPLVLRTRLLNGWGQVMAEDRQPFLVTDQVPALQVALDRPAYVAGGQDEAVVEYAVGNDVAGPLTGTLSLEYQGATLVQEDVSLGAAETLSGSAVFPVTGSGDVTLRLGGHSASCALEAAVPSLGLSIEAPALVRADPFDVAVNLRNVQPVDVAGTLELRSTLGMESTEISVPAGTERTYVMTARVDTTDTLLAVVSGDAGGSARAVVGVGPVISVMFKDPPSHAPGDVVVPYLVRNEGTMGTGLDMVVSVEDEVRRVSRFLAPGEAAEGEVAFRLAEGAHELAWSHAYGRGSRMLFIGAPAVELVSVTLEAGAGVGPPSTPGSLGTIDAGATAALQITVHNPSPTVGVLARVARHAEGIGDARQEVWLKPGASATLDDALALTPDALTGPLRLVVSVPGSEHDYTCDIAGAHVVATASLDHAAYEAGDTAHVTVNVTNPGAALSGMLVTADYDGSTVSETLDVAAGGHAVATLDVPVTVDDDVSVQVHQGGGRSLVIDVLSLRVDSGPVRVHVDRQDYAAGATVHATATADTPTTVTLRMPGWTETLGGMTVTSRDVVLPSLARGRYGVEWWVGSAGGLVPFDVDGPQLTVTGAAVSPLVATDAADIETSMTLSAHLVREVVMEWTLEDPNGQVIDSWEDWADGLAEGVATAHSSRRRITVEQPGLHTIRLQAWDAATGVRVFAGRLVALEGDATATEPRITGRTPESGESGVCVGSGIALWFNRDMDESSTVAAFTLTPAVELAATWLGPNRLLLVPGSGNLEASTTYTCRLGTGALDSGGVPLGSAVEWNFQTGAHRATPEEVRDVILGAPVLDAAERAYYDRNGDGVVDVADVLAAGR